MDAALPYNPGHWYVYSKRCIIVAAEIVESLMTYRGH